jgi:predicted RNase H-like HicB family nuclease
MTPMKSFLGWEDVPEEYYPAAMTIKENQYAINFPDFPEIAQIIEDSVSQVLSTAERNLKRAIANRQSKNFLLPYPSKADTIPGEICMIKAVGGGMSVEINE